MKQTRKRFKLPKKKQPPKSDETVHLLDDIKKLYPDLNDETEVDTFCSEPYHIHTDKTVPPKGIAPRPVPVDQQNAFLKELKKMLNLGVIVPVNKATPWISSFVIVCPAEGKIKQLKKLG